MERQPAIRLRSLWPALTVPLFAASFPLEYDWVGLTFLLVILESALFLSYALAGCVNLLLTFYLFSMIFLGLVPWLHYSTNTVIWRPAPLTEQTYLYVNLLLLAANLLVFVAYLFARRGATPEDSRKVAPRHAGGVTLVVLSLIGLGGVFYINGFSITNLLIRGSMDIERETMVESSALSLILALTTRLLPAFCFYYAVTSIPKKLALKIFLFCVMVLAAFPTGISRYMVGFIYIPLILLMFRKLRKAEVFAAIIAVSLLLIFPFLDQFRRFSGFAEISLLPSQEFFYAAHFDAYENLASTVENHFVTSGYQLLGVLLFFVPRTMWPDKPVGSGYELAVESGYIFQNISMPFLGEGYVNFGVAGVILFALLIGFTMGRLDGRFSNASMLRSRVSYATCVFFFLIGALFFVLRGDLLSSFAYVVAGLFVAWAVGRIMALVNVLSVQRP